MYKKYWAKIHVPEWRIIQSSTLQYIQKNNIIDQLPRNGFIVLDYNTFTAACPQITSCLNKYNNVVLWAGIYLTRDSAYSKIHIDYDGDQHQCRLNIPILNCKNTTTEFYEGGQYTSITQQNGLNFLYETSGTAVKVDEVELDSPTILRVKSPHKIVMHTAATPRISLTLYTQHDLVEYLL